VTELGGETLHLGRVEIVLANEQAETITNQRLAIALEGSLLLAVFDLTQEVCGLLPQCRQLDLDDIPHDPVIHFGVGMDEDVAKGDNAR
jgi:hypothetical protein